MRLQSNTYELFMRRDRRISACNNAIHTKTCSLTPKQIINDEKLQRQSHELIVRANATLNGLLKGN